MRLLQAQGRGSRSYTIGKFPLHFGDSFSQERGKEKEQARILTALQPFLTLNAFLSPSTPCPNKERLCLQRTVVFAVLKGF